MAAAREAPFDHRLLADDPHERDVAPRLDRLVDDRAADDFEPFYFAPRRRAAGDRHAAQVVEHLARELGLAHRRAVGQEVQRIVALDDAEIFGDADMVLIEPAAGDHRAGSSPLGNERISVLRVFVLEFVPGDIVHHESKAGIAAIHLLDVRVEIDAHRVADALDAKPHLEAAVSLVFADDAPPADPAMDLLGGCRVIRYRRIRHVFDVTNHALINIGAGFGRFVTDRADAHLWFILFRIVNYLQTMLPGLVDGQRRGIAAHGEHLVGPLPVIVFVAVHKARVVEILLAEIAFPVIDPSEALARLEEDIFVRFASRAIDALGGAVTLTDSRCGVAVTIGRPQRLVGSGPA